LFEKILFSCSRSCALCGDSFPPPHTHAGPRIAPTKQYPPAFGLIVYVHAAKSTNPPPARDVIVSAATAAPLLYLYVCVVQSQGQIFSSGALAPLLRLACDKIMTLLIIISAIGTCKRRDTCRPLPAAETIIIAAPRDLPAWLVDLTHGGSQESGPPPGSCAAARARGMRELFVCVCVSSWSMLLQRFDSTTKINYNLWERCAQHTRPGFAPKRLGPPFARAL
jgi:hypothetical protein